MVASIWLRAAHRGVPTLLVTALLLGQSPMALAESPAQRQELVAALRQLDALERTVADSAAHAPIQPGEQVTYQIVGEDEADLKHGLINISSPIARALIGKEEGDTAVVQAPGGDRHYEIIAVRYV